MVCNGGLRVGNRVFHCWNHHGHGSVNMAHAIRQSCDVYFYYFAQKMGMDVISNMARRMGLGQSFDLPVLGQSYGTVPDPAWKLRKYGKEWQIYDTVNATIGQGYFLVNPLQQAVVATRIATGKKMMPHMFHGAHDGDVPSLGIPQDHLALVHEGMRRVVNGPDGSAPRAKLPLPDIQMAGKSGTAQVVGLQHGNGKGGLWKNRDHGHFICFAPFDNPRYAIAVAIEHGGGSPSAYPIARDVMTYLFDKDLGMKALEELEKGWGGTPKQRLDARFRQYVAEYGTGAPKVTNAEEAAEVQQVDNTQNAPQPIVNDAQSPAPEPVNVTPNAPKPAAPVIQAPSARPTNGGGQ